MLLTIHDANLQKVAYIDNEKQSTLNYYNDFWHRQLETGSSTFEFTVSKKSIKTDTAKQKAYSHLNEKAFVSFRYNGKSYIFNVMTVEEDEKTIKCYCENLNLELINEYSNAFKADKAMTFLEYCEAMELLSFSFLTIGINEISKKKLKLEWEGQDTKLARLLSLANKFDAEIEFETKLNPDSSIKTFKINVFNEYDGENQGVGRVRNDVQLIYGKNLKSIKRKIDKTGIYTMIRPTGKGKTKNENDEEIETTVTIEGLEAWSEKNSDGVREFYQKGDSLYAPLAAHMFPSTFTTKTQDDQWIRKDMTVDSDDPKVIRVAAIKELKKNAYPAISYEVDGFVDVEIGDTVKIFDDGFSPVLLIKARVSEQKISFTNPNSNKTTFANFKALENNLSDGIQAAFERLFEAAKLYTIKLATDSGVIFKNQIGESLVTPTLYKGGKPVVAGVTWRWSLDGEVTTGMTYLVRGSNVTDTVTLTVAAYIGNDEVAVDEITLVNVVDGKVGTPGVPGKDGKTSYVHTAWADDETGSQGFSLTGSANKLYIGIYTDFEPNDSTDPTRYKWSRFRGEKGTPGERGIQGLQGPRGEKGIAGERGSDGRTQYTHIAYADNATGGGFSQTNQNKAYIGMYVDFNATDSTNPAAYKWTKWKGDDGAQGVPGAKGADGRTPYVHFAYANSADGRTDFSNTNSTNKRYVGTYTDYTQADSSDPTKYKWVDMVGSIEIGGRNLLLGTRNFDGTVWNHNTNKKSLTDETYKGFKVNHATHIWNGLGQKIDLIAGEKLTFSAWVSSSVNSDEVRFYTSYGIGATTNNGYTWSIDRSWKRVSVTFEVTRSGEIPIRLERKDSLGTLKMAGFKLERGTVATDWTPAPEDLENAISEKADQVLTQEQLNALNEKSQILEVEMQAKVSMETFSELEKAYKKFVDKNLKDIADSEKDLIEAGRRIELLTTQFGGMAELKTFIDTYMKSTNEGLVIGKNDASSTIKVSSDRISMFSAGREVMYISQGVIHIDNGIFTTSVHVGKFRTEQYNLDPDVNVIRYVG